jgi:hypothetical protein
MPEQFRLDEGGRQFGAADQYHWAHRSRAQVMDQLRGMRLACTSFTKEAYIEKVQTGELFEVSGNVGNIFFI